MADVITRLKVESSEYDAKIQRASKSLADMTHQAEVNGNKIATANKENIALAQSLGKMQTVATSVRGKMSELTAAFENAAHSYNRLSAAEKNSSFGRALKGSVDQLATRIKNLRQEMATTQSQLGKTGGMGIGAQFGQGLSSAAAMFGPAALAIGGVTAAVSGMKKVMGDMIQINMQFEQSTANLASVMGKSRDEISDLTNQAKQLGATTQYTAIQITGLQENLARLGFTQNEILNSTKAVQAFATATGADLSEAATVAGAALRAFQMPATEMDRVASVLAVSTTKSALSFEKLATALPIVSPVAKQFGFTIEDTVTLLGKLSDAGFDASSAATATRNIFLNMANSSGKLAQALGRPIRSIEDLAPAMVELKNKGIDLADMLALTDKRSVAAFATFLDSAGTMTQFKDSITDCNDALDDMVNERLNTLEGSVTIMKSAWEGLLLTFSGSNGILKEVTDALTRLLTAWTNWRKREKGGMEGASTYEAGVTADIKKQLDEQIAAKRAQGVADDDLIAGSEKKKKKLEEEREKLLQLEKVWLDYQQAIKNAANAGMAGGKTLELALKKAEEAENKLIAAGGNKSMTREGIQKSIADKTDRIAQHDYIISALTPSSTATPAGGEGGEGGAEAASKKQLQILKAQYEEQEKAQIASLDRMAMNEADYEAEVYRIKRETLQKIADLYQDETAEKARANAALSQLDIQYQGTQMRLANKGNKKTKTYAQQTGPSGYSQEGISALRSEIQGGMKSMQMGSAEYMVEADRLADLASFENLLKTAVQAGIQIDPAILEENFENIDLGVDVSDDQWESLVEEINAQLAALDLPAIELDVRTGAVKEAKKEMGGLTDNVQGAISVFGQLGGAMQQLEDPGAKVAGLIMSAIAEVAATFASSLKGTFTPWDWIAAAISGTSTMIATIAAIKSATSGSYASGGVVPGSSFSGDNTIIAANAGEVVLNRAQQTNLASQLEAGSLTNNLHLSTEISGTNLRVVLDNDNRSKGGSRGAYSRIK